MKFYSFSFLYAFHNKDFRNAFRKTLSKYIICCRQRRTSTSSCIPLPPATPSGEIQRTGSNKQKARNKKTKKRSKSNINEPQAANATKLIRGNNGLETSNGNATVGENSTSPKRNSCL